MKKDMILLFNQGFEEIVLPHIERIDSDISDIKKDLKLISGRGAAVDRKVDHILGDQIVYEQKVNRIDKRLEKLEKSKKIA